MNIRITNRCNVSVYYSSVNNELQLSYEFRGCCTVLKTNENTNVNINDDTFVIKSSDGEFGIIFINGELEIYNKTNEKIVVSRNCPIEIGIK